jgi:hypothetical protein
MSFRKFGGRDYAAKNNYMQSQYSSTGNQLVTNKTGLTNSRIEYKSHIGMSNNSILDIDRLFFNDKTMQSTAYPGLKNGDLIVKGSLLVEKNADIEGILQASNYYKMAPSSTFSVAQVSTDGNGYINSVVQSPMFIYDASFVFNSPVITTNQDGYIVDITNQNTGVTYNPSGDLTSIDNLEISGTLNVASETGSFYTPNIKCYNEQLMVDCCANFQFPITVNSINSQSDSNLNLYGNGNGINCVDKLTVDDMTSTGTATMDIITADDISTNTLNCLLNAYFTDLSATSIICTQTSYLTDVSTNATSLSVKCQTTFYEDISVNTITGCSNISGNVLTLSGNGDGIFCNDTLDVSTNQFTSTGTASLHIVTATDISATDISTNNFYCYNDGFIYDLSASTITCFGLSTLTDISATDITCTTIGQLNKLSFTSSTGPSIYTDTDNDLNIYGSTGNDLTFGNLTNVTIGATTLLSINVPQTTVSGNVTVGSSSTATTNASVIVNGTLQTSNICSAAGNNLYVSAAQSNTLYLGLYNSLYCENVEVDATSGFTVNATTTQINATTTIGSSGSSGTQESLTVNGPVTIASTNTASAALDCENGSIYCGDISGADILCDTIKTSGNATIGTGASNLVLSIPSANNASIEAADDTNLNVYSGESCTLSLGNGSNVDIYASTGIYCYGQTQDVSTNLTVKGNVIADNIYKGSQGNYSMATITLGENGYITNIIDGTEDFSIETISCNYIQSDGSGVVNFLNGIKLGSNSITCGQINSSGEITCSSISSGNISCGSDTVTCGTLDCNLIQSNQSLQLLSSFPTSNTSAYGYGGAGLGIYWNHSGGSGEIDLLGMGQDGNGGAASGGFYFYASDNSHAPEFIASIVPGGLTIGTSSLNQNLTVNGTVTSSGNFSCGTHAVTCGAITSSGAFSCGTNAVTSGAITSSGAFSCGTNAVTCGAITSSGAFNCETNAVTSGAITSSGAFSCGTNAVTCGAITSSGAFSCGTNAVTCGAITSSGNFSCGSDSVTCGSVSCSGNLTCGSLNSGTASFGSDSVSCGSITCSSISCSGLMTCNNIQTSSVQSGSGGAATINFSPAFLNTPNVICQFYEKTENWWGFVSIQTVSESSCTIIVRDSNGNGWDSNNPVTIMWIAITL